MGDFQADKLSRHDEQLKTIFNILDELKAVDGGHEEEIEKIKEKFKDLTIEVRDQKAWYRESLKDVTSQIKEVINENEAKRRAEEYERIKLDNQRMTNEKREVTKLVRNTVITTAIGIILPIVLLAIAGMLMK